MKRTIITCTVLLALVGLANLFRAPKAQTLSSSAAIAAPAPAPMAVPIPPRCPRIHEAIRALEAAENDMHNAAHDFCGHKREAMEATHHAIEQLRAAEACASCD
jgi:hypothetical protein